MEGFWHKKIETTELTTSGKAPKAEFGNILNFDLEDRGIKPSRGNSIKKFTILGQRRFLA